MRRRRVAEGRKGSGHHERVRAEACMDPGLRVVFREIGNECEVSGQRP